MRWSVETRGEFFDCNESTVVYFDPASGITHLLSAFAAHLVLLLADNPMDTQLLIETASAQVESQGASNLDRSVPEILDELAALDIISQA